MLEKNKEKNPWKKQNIGKSNCATYKSRVNVSRILAHTNHPKMCDKSEILWATPKPPFNPNLYPRNHFGVLGVEVRVGPLSIVVTLVYFWKLALPSFL
jgi:hypothetical protein